MSTCGSWRRRAGAWTDHVTNILKLSVANFAGLLEALTKELPYQQLRLNYEFRDRLDEFVLLMEKAKGTVGEAILFSIAPQARTLDEVEMKAMLRAEFSQESQTELRVQVLNLGFMKRYKYSAFSEARIEVSARRTPPEPGKNLKLTS